ncbi:hypothetical protein D1007_38952 [Hordeum vulgare]|nr:hypothetical protein D1007_38952 [Hordeum vulgare]
MGKLITADLASFVDDGPARIEILCPAPAEIDGLSLVFYFGSKGRRLTFELESPASAAQLDPVPPGPEPADGGLDEEEGSSEEGSSSEGDDDTVGAPPEPSGDLALREIARVGARFTWWNKQEDPIQSVLDRVFVLPKWEVMFLLCGLRAITQIGSDHTPLLFSSGEGSPPRSRRFRFETFWLDQPGFRELVRDRWHRAAASPPRVYCAVDIWHHCAKMARQAMKGWGANLGADLRARKGALLGQIKTLDDLADGTGLSPDYWIRRYSLDAELMGIFSSEELFWQRRGGQNWLLKGDANTAYFQAIANGRRRKCVIPFLRDGDALLESPKDISSHIYSFYKELFSADLRGGSSLCEDFWPLADQVSDVENAELTLPFSSEEVGHAIASMKACSAQGPDGLPVVFFQRFWETVRPVIMPMFHEFYIGTLDMGMINYGVIALIPKLLGAAEIRQFRPIMVINVVARIFAKVCATRLSHVAERSAHPLQSAFLKGRKIHDGILALHEIVRRPRD